MSGHQVGLCRASPIHKISGGGAHALLGCIVTLMLDRYQMIDLRGQHPRTKPVAAEAMFVLDGSEPTALGGLQRSWQILEGIGMGLLSIIPSWLPQWQSELPTAGISASVQAERRSNKQPQVDSPAIEVSLCSWHPNKSLLALAVWRKLSGADGVKSVVMMNG